MTERMLAVLFLAVASTGCRETKSDDTSRPGATEAGAPSSSETSAPTKCVLEGVAEEDVRALCALAALSTPPEHESNHDWDSAVIEAKKSKRRFGWVKMTGVASKMKLDDVGFYVMSLDVGRANADTSFDVCGRFRKDPERKVLVTVTYRTSGDARKGDYLTYVALGMGHENPNGVRSALKGVSAHDAKVATLKTARELIGETDLTQRSGIVDDWKTALERP